MLALVLKQVGTEDSLYLHRDPTFISVFMLDIAPTLLPSFILLPVLDGLEDAFGESKVDFNCAFVLTVSGAGSNLFQSAPQSLDSTFVCAETVSRFADPVLALGSSSAFVAVNRESLP